MEKLIAEDPELALQQALPKQILQILPSKIRKNMENWQEGHGDLLSHFGCNRGGDHQMFAKRKSCLFLITRI